MKKAEVEAPVDDLTEVVPEGEVSARDIVLIDRIARAADNVLDRAHKKSLEKKPRAMRGLQAHEIRILIHVAENGRFGVFAVARSMGVQPKGMSSPIKRLEDKGYVQRRTIQRATKHIPTVQVLLTERGKRALAVYRDCMREVVAEVSEQVDNDVRIDMFDRLDIETVWNHAVVVTDCILGRGHAVGSIDLEDKIDFEAPHVPVAAGGES